MLGDVKPGEKILASQYNDLVKAVQGPVAASNEIPFTQTATGTMLNGGVTQYNTKASSVPTAFLETSYGVGQLTPQHAAYTGNPKEDTFSGAFVNIGNVLAAELFGGVDSPMKSSYLQAIDIIALIDFTATQDKLILLSHRRTMKGTNKYPLCRASESAGVGIFQLFVDEETTMHSGILVMIIGDFTKLGGAFGNLPTSCRKERVMEAIEGYMDSGSLKDIKLVASSSLWLNGQLQYPELTYSSTNIAYNAKTQFISPTPDSYEEDKIGICQTSVLLSSLAYTPGEQLDIDPDLYFTYVEQLFHFDQLSDEISGWNKVYEQDKEYALSGWDLIVRHKAEHPDETIRAKYPNQCSAYLDYVPLSGFLMCDAEVDKLFQQEGREPVACSSLTHTSADTHSAFQMFKFEDNEYLSSFNEALSNQTLLSSLDLVVRHRNYDDSSCSRIEYYNLSSILSGSALPCDTEATAGLQNKYRSLDTMLSGDGSPYYELHDFHKADEPGYGTRVKFEDSQHEEDFSIANGTQFVVRKPNGAGGFDIKYQHLSVVQEHERVDSSGAAIQTISRSLQYETYPGIGTNYDVMELYNFSSGCTTSLVSADISADPGNGVLVRTKNRDTYDLQYMDFKSIDNFAKKYVGDSQLDQQPLTPVDKSANVYWSNNDQKYAVELYNFKNGADTANVSIRTDGCTYWWPQNVKTTSQMNEWDYVLVKHLDSQGNQELQYKQLAVTMPDLSGLGDGLSAISAVVYKHSIEITTLSSEVIELSGKLSADYWEQGGDNTTCYGSSIGDSSKTAVIDLDNKTLEGYWIADTQLDIGCTWFEAASGDGYVAGTLTVAGCLLANSDVRCGCVVYANSGLTIGNTTINEAQLSALLQLIS